jgi:predicted AAA+ superfamily ATPase
MGRSCKECWDDHASWSGTIRLAIDEFHRAPDVLSYVKRVVDRQGGTARFLLAGSVSSFLLPPGTETLTGRAHRLSLMPLATAEVFGAKHRWLAELLAAGEPRNFRTTLERSDVFDVVAAGGYPAALRRATPAQRTRWFASYLATVTDRDLPDLIDVRHSGALPRLYRLIAQRTSSMAVNTELSQALDVAQPTASSYRRLLERLYLTAELPGWTVGVSAKTGHRAKVHVTDTGLAAGVRRIASGLESRLRCCQQLLGPSDAARGVGRADVDALVGCLGLAVQSPFEGGRQLGVDPAEQIDG